MKIKSCSTGSSGCGLESIYALDTICDITKGLFTLTITTLLLQCAVEKTADGNFAQNEAFKLKPPLAPPRRLPNVSKCTSSYCMFTSWKWPTVCLRSPLSQTWTTITSHVTDFVCWQVRRVREAAVVFRPAVKQPARRKARLLFQTTTDEMRGVWKVSLCAGHQVQIQQANQWQREPTASNAATWFWKYNN